MTDKELKDLQEQVKDPSRQWPPGVVRLIVDELVSLHEEKKQLINEVLAVTNCGFCSLCRERHGK